MVSDNLVMSAYKCHRTVSAAGFAEFIGPVLAVPWRPEEPLPLLRVWKGPVEFFKLKVRKDGRTVRAGRGELFNARYLKYGRSRRRAGGYRHRAKR